MMVMPHEEGQLRLYCLGHDVVPDALSGLMGSELRISCGHSACSHGRSSAAMQDKLDVMEQV